MKKNSIAILFFLCFLLFLLKIIYPPTKPTIDKPANDQIINAFTSRESDIQVLGKGKVIKLLADDTKGLEHQRFIVELGKSHTVLIAHNIDLAPRVPLSKGDTITFLVNTNGIIKEGSSTGHTMTLAESILMAG